jgi:hypothetical protein
MNAISINHDDLNDAVRATAMLADITIYMWSGERSDADVTNKIRADNQATGDVGRFVKKLLAGVDGPLKNTQSAFNAVRMRHYALTLPWVSDPNAMRQSGPRLLPNMLFERYMADMSKAKRTATALLDAFIAQYPDLVVQARSNLGGLADAVYPSPEDVRARFRVSFDFEPIPAGQSFQGLPDHLLGKLSANLAAKQNRMVSAANNAMWETVRERVAHIVERLGNADAMFKATTIENTRELITLIPGWNVVADPRALEIAADIENMLAGVTADTVRADGAQRMEVAQTAQRITDKIAQWGL